MAMDFLGEPTVECSCQSVCGPIIRRLGKPLSAHKLNTFDAPASVLTDAINSSLLASMDHQAKIT